MVSSLNRVWASPGEKVWVLGHPAQRCAFQRAGSVWNCIDPGFEPEGVSGLSANNVWFAGSGGQVARWNGTAMSPVSQLSGLDGSNAVTGVSANAVFQACETKIAQFDGIAWTSTPVAGLSMNEKLSTIWAVSATDVWAGTDQGKLVHWVGGATSIAASFNGSKFTAIWGASTTDIWAATQGGSFVHLTGGTWTPVGSGFTDPIWGLWGSSASDVYATGRTGGYLHYDGTSWTWKPVAWTSPFAAGKIHGTGPSDVWGLDGMSGDSVVHFDGTTWSRFSLGNVYLEDLWAAGPNDVFALGRGTVYHFDVHGWTSTRVTASPSRRIWGTGPRDLFLFTSSGVLRYQ